MSLKQQVKKLTRDIRKLKDERQRLRQTLREESRAKGQPIVESLRQKLAAQHPPASVNAWAKLVQTYVKRVLGHESFVSGCSSDTVRKVHWAYIPKGEGRLQHHCIYVERGGLASNLNVASNGETLGIADNFDMAKIPVQDWPL